MPDATGHEMINRHPGFVVSSSTLNKLGSLVWVCPISQGAANLYRDNGWLVSLMSTGTRTQGNVHVPQLRALDLSKRNFRYIERADAEIVDQVVEVIQNLIPI